jgi:type IV pilus assembly protein PilC
LTKSDIIVQLCAQLQIVSLFDISLAGSMPIYRYKISTPSGRIIEKSITSSSKASVKEYLEQEGNFVLNISKEHGLGSFFKQGRRRGHLKLKDFLIFNQEFSVLIKAGLPITQALNAIIKNGEKDDLTDVLIEIRNDVSAGSSLSEAFRTYSHMFSNLYIASLQSGEKSGNIGLSITRYISYIKKISEIRHKIISASVYPVILTVVSVFALFFLLIYVVPSFTSTYFEAGTELPKLTLILVDFSNLLKSSFIYMLILLGAIIIGFKYSIRSEVFKSYLDKMKIKVPFLGAVYIHYSISKFARTLATILSGGIPLVESIRISSGVMENSFLKENLMNVAGSIEKGAGFSESLSAAGVFPVLALRMIEAGESSGALEQVLDEIAEFYEGEVDTKISVLTSAIEPALMVIMGLLIGFIVLAMYMPIFQMAGTIR